MSTNNNINNSSNQATQLLLSVPANQRMQLLQYLEEYEAAQNLNQELADRISQFEVSEIKPLQEKLDKLTQEREAKQAAVKQLQAEIEQARQALLANKTTTKAKDVVSPQQSTALPVREKASRLAQQLQVQPTKPKTVASNQG